MEVSATPAASATSRRALRQAEVQAREQAQAAGNVGRGIAGPGRTRWADSWWPAVAVAALAAVLRLRGLGTESLWIDEGYTAQLVQLGPVAYVQDVLHTIRNILPPLYFVVLHVWTALFGDSETVLRLPSAIAGVAAVLVIHRLARLTVGPRAALVAAVLLATSPFHVWYSQEARPYELLALLQAIALWLLVRVLTPQPGRPEGPAGREVVGLATVDALILYTHHHGVLLLAAQAAHVVLLAVTGSLPRPTARACLRAGGLTGVLALPWLALFVNQLGKVHEFAWLPRPTPAAVWHVLVTFAGSTWSLVCMVLLLAVGAVDRRQLVARIAARRPLTAAEQHSLLLWSAFTLPLLATFAWSLLVTPVFGAKYVIATSIPFLVLVADGAARLRSPQRLTEAWPGGGAVRTVPVAPAVAVVVTVLGAVPSLYRDATRIDKEQWRDAVAWVESYASPGDLVLFNAGYTMASGFDTYARRTDLVERPFPLDSADFATVPTAAELARLPQLTRGRRHAWVVYAQTRDRDYTIAAALDALASDGICRDYVGISVCGYTMAASTGTPAAASGASVGTG